MKRSKGFTLIELLAVIVILAVIALIAVPQVLKILNKARLSAAEDTTYGIVKSAENYVTEFMLQNNGLFPNEELEFKCENKKCELQNIPSEYNTENLTVLEFKGTKPTSGIVTISNNGKTVVATNLIINGFTCNYPVDGKAKCNGDGVSSDNTNENTTTTTTTTTTPVVEVGPTCVETCYWYYTKTNYTICKDLYSSHSCYDNCEDSADESRTKAESHCGSEGYDKDYCSAEGQKAYDDSYNDCINGFQVETTTNIYYTENNEKVEYSCDTPPSSIYTKSKIATSCE